MDSHEDEVLGAVLRRFLTDDGNWFTLNGGFVAMDGSVDVSPAEMDLLRHVADPENNPLPKPCGCWTCVSERRTPALAGQVMIVCPECGNKRCPKASRHDNACTGSNDPGQPGSRYGGLPH